MITSPKRSFGETHSEQALGILVAGALHGVWRKSLPAISNLKSPISDVSSPISDLGSQISDLRSQMPEESLSEETLSLITPLLYASGSAALGWWRIRNSELAGSAPGVLLHDAYRRSRLNALIHEREIKHVLSLLRAAGIEPILVKGWAIARHYPDHALRPYGDIDLCIRPDQFSQAEAALKCLETIDGHYVDLHHGFGKFTWHGRPARVRTKESTVNRVEYSARRHGQDAHATFVWHELFERSQIVMLGETSVRVLSAEDHLRVLCLHLLRSGAWRPVWLCDIALAVESRPANFDWARCLGTDPLVAKWLSCTIGLAHQLLGADVNAPNNKFGIRNSQFAIPHWLAPAVLRQWGRAKGPSETEMLLPALIRNIGLPSVMFRELRARWDRPVVASFKLRAPLNNFPRAPYQLADLLLRSAQLPAQSALMLREQLKRFRFESFRRPAASEH